MSVLKMVVRIILALMCFYGATNGQIVNSRQQVNLQRQQKQLNEQQEQLEKQLLSQVSTRIFNSIAFPLKQSFQATIFPFLSRDQQTQPPINHAILDSIFNVSLLASMTFRETKNSFWWGYKIICGIDAAR